MSLVVFARLLDINVAYLILGNTKELLLLANKIGLIPKYWTEELK